MNTKQYKDRNRDHFLQLNELGIKYGLSFSSQEALGNKLIGFDGINRKLLILEEKNGKDESYIIDLEELACITVKQDYRSINVGELKKKKIEEFLKTIVLQFEFKNGNEHIYLSFYDRNVNHINEIAALEEKAKNWQVVLSKLISGQSKQRA